MERELVLENQSITVWVYPAEGIVHHQMHCFTRGDDFRDALRAGTEALVKHGGSAWLSDNRAHVILPPEDETWAKTEWFPSTQRAGWKRWAIVQPESAVGQMNMRRLVEGYAARGLTARFFTDPEAALSWLRAG